MGTRVRHTELQMQYAQLIQPGNCPEGVYLCALDNLDKWDGIIFIRRGYYQGCILRFNIEFPSEYPLRAPTVHFEKGCIVHPLVDTDNVTKLLFFIKSIFKIFTLDKLNDGLVVNTEAWRLYRFNRPVFAKLAIQCATVSSSSSTLYGRGIAPTEKEQDAEAKLYQHTPSGSIPFRELSELETQAVRETIFG